MRTLFENTTEYTKEVYTNYKENHFKKYGIKEMISIIIIIILSVYCLIVNMISKNWILFLLLAISVAGYLIYKYLCEGKRAQHQKKGKRRIKRKAKRDKAREYDKEENNEFNFYFYQNFFIVKNGKDINEVKYCNLHKINNVKKYIYLYINKNHAFILAKEGFTKGTYLEFKEFIMQKFKKRIVNFFQFKNQ